jgi:membrane dipeptidase
LKYDAKREAFGRDPSRVLAQWASNSALLTDAKLASLETQSVSRRDFLVRAGRLAGLALGGGMMTLLPGCASTEAQDPELIRIVDSLIGVDVHSHAGGVHFRTLPDIDLAGRMRQGRMTAVCLGHTGDGPVIRRAADGRTVTSRAPAPGELWRHTQTRLDFFDRMVSTQGLRRALQRGDLEQAHRNRAPAIVQMIEGCQFLEGRLERVAEVHRRGVRQLQLVHFLRSDLGDIQTDPPERRGLTALGREVIAECNRLGMVVDTAHGTMQLVEQAAAASRAPLVLSHTHVTPRPGPLSRLVSREHARLIAQTDGVVGIWGIATPSETLPYFTDRVARAVDAVGVDHVSLGSDVGGASHNIWSDYASFPEIVRLLRQKGFSVADIGKIAGGNYVRVFNASC